MSTFHETDAVLEVGDIDMASDHYGHTSARGRHGPEGLHLLLQKWENRGTERRNLRCMTLKAKFMVPREQREVELEPGSRHPTSGLEFVFPEPMVPGSLQIHRGMDLKSGGMVVFG